MSGIYHPGLVLTPMLPVDKKDRNYLVQQHET